LFFLAKASKPALSPLERELRPLRYSNRPENSMNTHRTGAALALLLALAPVAQALPLAPQYEGVYLDGDGANSRWVQVANRWRGSIYGDERRGTGISGLADHAVVMELDAGDRKVKRTLETRVDQINFGDQAFINRWGRTWGVPELAPLFDDSAPGRNGQNNWASSFWGYIAIPEAGAYNFGVLFDDGFRFSLMGAGGESVQIFKDGLNPRDRLGVAADLLLDPGLYAYQLDAYERLQAGVVQLSWWTPGAKNWAVIPTANLHTGAPAALAVRAVPEPTVALLLLAGLASFGLTTRLRGA
jgi:hypothetical protein